MTKLLCLLVSALASAVLTLAQEKTAKDVSFCGPAKEKHKVTAHRESERLPEPPPGKAVIYFMWRGASWRSWKGVQLKLALDGRWRAVLSKNTYSRLEVDPGVQRLCMGTYRNVTTPDTILFLTVQAGNRYFLEGSPGDVWGKKTQLQEIEESRARRILENSRLATFTTKGRNP